MGMSQPFTFNMTANEVRFAFRSWHLSYLFALDLSFPTFSWVNLFFFFFCLMIPFYLHYLLERLSLSLGSLSLLASSPRQHQHIANFLRKKKKNNRKFAASSFIFRDFVYQDDRTFCSASLGQSQPLRLPSTQLRFRRLHWVPVHPAHPCGSPTSAVFSFHSLEIIDLGKAPFLVCIQTWQMPSGKKNGRQSQLT